MSKYCACSEILDTVIINYETTKHCGINVWLEPEERLEDFKSSLILTKFKIKIRKIKYLLVTCKNKILKTAF